MRSETGDSMKEIEKLKKAILDEYPRLTENDKFCFKCHPGVSCFNDCCADVNIFLTPYDIIRLRKNLGITSEEFLKKYTLAPFDKNLKYPVVMLKMEDNEKKSCPFVTEAGCGVYPDRPWPCRMYPLGLASPKKTDRISENEFYFILHEDVCKGFNEKHEQTVSDWIAEQGIEEYNRMGEYFKEFTLSDFFQKGGDLPPQKIEMFFTTCYNIDTFRRFLFNTSFFAKFNIDEITIEKLKNDDVELMKFGFLWLRFAIFGEKTLSLRDEVAISKEKELRAKGKIKDIQ